MKILAVDTSTQVCGIGLTEEASLVAEYRLNRKNVHNEKLVAAIQYVLSDSNWRIQDLNAIAVSNGPGSFTGLRIGLAVCKGLAFTLDIPIVAVNTLDALAQQADHWQGSVAAILKARQNEFYFALYDRREGALQRRRAYQVVTDDELAEMLQEKTLVVAYPQNLYTLLTRRNKNCVAAAAEASSIRPYTIARMGYEKLQNNEIENPASLEPFYLKPFAARKKSYYGIT